MVKNLSYKYYVVQYAYQIFQIFSLLSLILTQISKQRRGTIALSIRLHLKKRLKKNRSKEKNCRKE